MFAAHGLAECAGPGDVSEIMKRFEPQDAATQMYLIIGLVRIGNDEAYAALRELFKSPKRLVRLYVTSTVAEAPNGSRAIPLLTEALSDDIPEIRLFAVLGLKKLNLQETFPLTVQTLADPYAHVRKEAAETLGNLGKREAAPYLLSSLEDPNFLVRSHSAEALGKIGDPSLIPDIKVLIADPNPYVQIKAAGALARLHDYSEVNRLLVYLNSPTLLYRAQAYEAMCSFSNKDFGNDTDAWVRWWKQTRETMSPQRPGDVP
jgi:HEAT repeat protein